MPINLVKKARTLLETAISDAEFMSLMKYKFTNLVFSSSGKNVLYEGNANDIEEDTWYCLAYWLKYNDTIKNRFQDYSNYLEAGNTFVAKNNILNLIKCRVVFFILMDKFLDYYKVDNKSGWIVYNKLQPGQIINSSTVSFSLTNVAQNESFEFKISPFSVGRYADQLDKIKIMPVSVEIRSFTTGNPYTWSDACRLENLKTKLRDIIFPFALNALLGR